MSDFSQTTLRPAHAAHQAAIVAALEASDVSGAFEAAQRYLSYRLAEAPSERFSWWLVLAEEAFKAQAWEQGSNWVKKALAETSLEPDAARDLGVLSWLSRWGSQIRPEDAVELLATLQGETNVLHLRDLADAAEEVLLQLGKSNTGQALAIIKLLAELPPPSKPWEEEHLCHGVHLSVRVLPLLVTHLEASGQLPRWQKPLHALFHGFPPAINARLLLQGIDPAMLPAENDPMHLVLRYPHLVVDSRAGIQWLATLTDDDLLAVRKAFLDRIYPYVHLWLSAARALAKTDPVKARRFLTEGLSPKQTKQYLEPDWELWNDVLQLAETLLEIDPSSAVTMLSELTDRLTQDLPDTSPADLEYWMGTHHLLPLTRALGILSEHATPEAQALTTRLRGILNAHLPALASFESLKGQMRLHGFSQADPDLATRIVKRRGENFTWVKEALAHIEQVLAGIPDAIWIPLFELTCDQWDPHATAWSREQIIAELALELLQKTPDHAVSLILSLRHPYVRKHARMGLFRMALVRKLDVRWLRGVVFRHPLLDEGTLTEKQADIPVFSGWFLPDQDPEALLQGIDRLPNPDDQLLALAWALRHGGSHAEQAMAGLTNLLSVLEDGDSTAQLLVKIPLLVGGDFGPRTRLIYQTLLERADATLVHTPDLTTPLLFRMIHRLPPERCEEILSDYLDNPRINRPVFDTVQALVGHATTLTPATWTALLRRFADRVSEHFQDRFTVPIDRFVAELARHDLGRATALCLEARDIADEDVTETAYEALASLAFDEALEASRNLERKEYKHAPPAHLRQNLPKAVLEEYAALRGHAAPEVAFSAWIAAAPHAEFPLAILRDAYPEFPSWLVEAHVENNVWPPLLAAHVPLSAEQIRCLEDHLEARLAKSRKSDDERFLPNDADAYLLIDDFFHANAEQAVAWALQQIPLADRLLRAVLTRQIATCALPRDWRLKALASVLGSLLRDMSQSEFDLLFAYYAELASRSADTPETSSCS